MRHGFFSMPQSDINNRSSSSPACMFSTSMMICKYVPRQPAASLLIFGCDWLLGCSLYPSCRIFWVFLHHFFPWFFNRLTLRPCCRCRTTGLRIGVSERPRERQRAGLVPPGSVGHAAQPDRSRVGPGDHGGDVVPETGDGVAQQEGGNQVGACKDAAVAVWNHTLLPPPHIRSSL